MTVALTGAQRTFQRSSRQIIALYGSNAESYRHNMVVAIPKGKFTEYRASKIAHDDISRLKSAYPITGERPKFHGLTLKLTAEKLGKLTFEKAITNTLPLGGVVRAKMRGVAGVGTRETSFQLSKACLMVYCSCTNMPMDYDDFVTWLARVDGFLESKGWPRLMHNLELWVSRQFGFSNDYKLREANGLVRSVSLKGMWEWYAEVYEKKMPNGETVLRAGVHSTEEQTMASIVGMMSGDISRVYAEDLLRQTTEAQNINTRYLQETVKAVGKVRDVLAKGKVGSDDDTSFLLGRLEQKIDDIEERVDKLTLGQSQNNSLTERLVAVLERLTNLENKAVPQQQPQQQQQSQAPSSLG
ncbi:MAG: hypothetical protein PHI16_03910, partial [Methanocellales archaeon]|nr:hypothetical protein [Methanocellales archaeon]